MTKTLEEAFPDIAAEWHPLKNPFSPNEVSYGSAKKVWWKGLCGHEWESRIDQRTYKRRTKNGISMAGCPYCNKHKKHGSIDKTHPHVAKEWHPDRNNISPCDVTAGQHAKVWWKGKCGHEWEAHIHNRCKPTRPGGCPYCHNRMPHTSNSLATLFPEIARELHPSRNGDISADHLIATTYKKVWWLGRCGHEWQCLVHSRTRKANPTGCPVCNESKGEKAIEELLINMKLSYKKQVRFLDCRFKKPLPFDFEVEYNETRILIEFHGIQHYQPIRFGGTLKDTFQSLRKRDQIKRDWCARNMKQLLVIPYTEMDNIREILGREIGHAQAHS